MGRIKITKAPEILELMQQLSPKSTITMDNVIRWVAYKKATEVFDMDLYQIAHLLYKQDIRGIYTEQDINEWLEYNELYKTNLKVELKEFGYKTRYKELI